MSGRPDVLVVGAGSAGCVLAAGLSADPSRHVLLLEAGPDARPGSVPASIAGPSFLDACAEPGWTWPHLTARRARTQEPRPYVRGRGIGGSSAINAMVALAGVPEDYERWHTRYGCTGWGWDDLGPVLTRLVQRARPAPPEEWGAVDRALLMAGEQAGWPVPVDHHAPAAWGVGPARLTRDGSGRRVSAADHHLEPVRDRANLEVRSDAHVDRVLLDGRRATGVRLADGTEIEAAAVVLAAGAIHSPAILLRSGVERPGIGRNLQDHPSAPVTLVLRSHAVAPAGRATLSLATLARFSSGAMDADLQLLPMNHLGGAPEVRGLGLVMAALMHVRSRGELHLAGADPLLDPVVELGLLDHPDDVAAMVHGVRALRHLLQQPAFTGIVEAALVDEVGTPLEDLRDDGAIEAWLRGHTGDYVHVAGSCRMGPPDDPASVVDLEGRVIGYGGLRVGDASVMPEVPRANTHLTAMAVAELLAARIVAAS